VVVNREEPACPRPSGTPGVLSPVTSGRDGQGAIAQPEQDGNRQGYRHQ
jgi:hypothetical protein